MQINLFLTLLALLTVPLSLFIIEVARKLPPFRALRPSASSRGCKDPPCENSYDLFGLVKIISLIRYLLGKTAIANSTELFGKYGETYTSRILGEEVIFTCDPRNIKQVLVTRFLDYDSSVIRAHMFRPLTEHGIFAVDGPEWEFARDMYRNHFSNTRKIIDLQMQERHFQTFLSRVPPPGQPCDLQPLFLNLTLDLTTAFAIGESVNSLSLAQPDDKTHFVESLICVRKTLARDGFLGPAHVLLSKKDFYKACANVKRYVERYIVESLHRRRNHEAKDSKEFNLLDGLTENSEDMVSLRDGVITILIAGIDSVASLLSTTFWLLARDERVFQKLRANILNYIGQEAPTYEKLRNFAYLRYVLNEAMRIHPPVPFNARVANKDTILPYGGGVDAESHVLVQKEQKVFFSTWAAHRSTRSFGDDAHEFRPERWEHLQGESLGFMPFHSGPRACPGQQYARMEASYITVRILQTFSKIRNRDSRAWKENIGLTLFNDNGVVVEFDKE